ncbi:MAG: glycosyltransferase family 2 protein [Herpetosiphon sp.]
MGTVHLVILNYNRADLLKSCLASIIESVEAAPLPTELRIWVVDNASTDGSTQLVQQHFPQVDLIVNDHNAGFAAGNNLVLCQLIDLPEMLGQHDHVMLLNNDTRLVPGTLNQLLTFLESHPDVGAVGPKVLLPDNSLDLACRRSFPTPSVSFFRIIGLSRLFPSSPILGRYNMTFLPVDQQTDVDAVVGAAMLVRGTVLREVGPLDEAFWMYGEDLDWCFRIKSFGWRIVYLPRAVVFHHKRATSTRNAQATIRAFYDAMRVFHRKHYASTTVTPINLLIEIAITLRQWLALLQNRRLPASRRT